MPVDRMDRINELIRRQLSELFARELDLPHESFVTITRVNTSRDLSGCTISVSIAPDDAAKEILQYLEKRAVFFHHVLNEKITLRKIPKVRFTLDTTERHAARIEQLLNDIAKDGSQDKTSPHTP
ncbi:MAG TPA: 30S ribosome-binding factor RbfA [Candidatus Kerfeldbacteria bacterium]|nr:30S ribosome-binding factor RbfA [Candidatus Kerfeldbacteria bacterium]